MHVCLLTSSRIFDISYGGDGRFTTSLARWLTDRNLEVTLMGSGFINVKAKHFPRFSREEPEMIKKEKKIRTLKAGTKVPYMIYELSRIIMSALWVIKIISINMKFPITLIHAQDTGYAGLAAIISGKILGVPVLISSHGIRHKLLETVLHGRLKNLILKMEYSLDIFTLKNANEIMVDNSTIKNYFEQIISKNVDFVPVPIKIINFQFSEENRDMVRDELGIDKKAKVIGFVGRFSPEKNLHTLLLSFAEIAKLDSSLNLVLVGTGPLDSQLRDYVREREIEDRVVFTGIRYDIGKILSSFDIFILPSYIEGLSTSLLEAMSCGRAIICSDIPANREVVSHNKEGLLVDPHSADELKQAIDLLSHDDALRLMLGHNAKLRTTQYDEEIVFLKILQHYESLCRERDRITN